MAIKCIPRRKEFTAHTIRQDGRSPSPLKRHAVQRDLQAFLRVCRLQAGRRIPEAAAVGLPGRARLPLHAAAAVLHRGGTPSVRRGGIWLR